MTLFLTNSKKHDSGAATRRKSGNSEKSQAKNYVEKLREIHKNCQSQE